MALALLPSRLPDPRADRSRSRSVRNRRVEVITPDSRRAVPAMVFVSLPERQRENPFQGRAAGDGVVLAGRSPAGARRVGDTVDPWDEAHQAREVLAQTGCVGREI